MSASFKRIDYSLRPAKHAERRMLCDIFRRLHPFGLIEEYTYVGFGSVWFADFALFHRALGIQNMVSIEEAVNYKERIEDNKPFRITMDFRSSTEAIPDLNWSKNQFIWLDYDDPLSPNMLFDAQMVARRAKSGTVLAISMQCSQAKQVAEAKNSPDDSLKSIDRFFNAFGRSRVPNKTTEDELYGWLFGNLSREMTYQEIEKELAIRNSDISNTTMIFKPICDIEYEDGAKMTTVVGVFHSLEDQNKVQACNFDTLEFLTDPKKPIRINIPKLTSREFKLLESQLPLLNETQANLGSIPTSEANKFISMYRYLPNFAVLEG